MRAWQLSLVVGGGLIVLMWLVTGPRPDAAVDEAPIAITPASRPLAVTPTPPSSVAAKTDPTSLAPEPAARGPATVRRPGESEEADQAPDVPAPTRGGFIDALRNAYASSSADGSAAAMESEIFDLVAEQPDMLTIDAVDCHRTVCRIRMEWSRDQPTSYMALYMLLSQRVNQHMALDPQGDPAQDDPLPLEIYLLRRGYTLQDL